MILCIYNALRLVSVKHSSTLGAGPRRMKALVINLDKAQDRWEFQKLQLGRLSIKYERLSAVEVGSLSPEQYEREAYSWERPLRVVELACFLSHMKAWERVVELDENTLVLEDDALLSSVVPILLKEIEELEIDYASFETRKRKKLLSKSSRVLSHGYSAVEMFQDRCGAAGYFLSPKGAEILLNRYKSHGAALADAFIAHCYEWQAYQVVPAAIIQLDCTTHYGVPSPMQTVSFIATVEKPELRSTLEYIRFKLRRIWAQVRLGIRVLWKRGEWVEVSVQRKDFGDE